MYICEKFRNEKFRNMKNPFKYGTIVEDEYFTDRVNELNQIIRLMNSENHLVLISPRRFGKSSLVQKALKKIDGQYIMLNLQKVLTPGDLAALLLKEIFKKHPWERFKHYMRHFRVVPTISTNPLSESVDVSFQPSADTTVVLEDTMSLLEKMSSSDNHLIVVLDEFQEIMQISKGLDKQLRAIMQEQKNINYILLGSQESMMEEIFERKKSPFYHFGMLMRLKKIPYDDFAEYVVKRLQPILGGRSEKVTCEILSVTNCHPYYTQQLSSVVWELARYENETDDVVDLAIDRLLLEHDLDFERLWTAFNKMDRRVLLALCKNENPMLNRTSPPSTTYSAIKRLVRNGYIIHSTEYVIEDPLFKCWIERNQL